MIVLIAFVWRTVTYQAQPTTVQAKVCSLNAGNCLFNINNKTVTVALLPVRKLIYRLY